MTFLEQGKANDKNQSLFYEDDASNFVLKQ